MISILLLSLIPTLLVSLSLLKKKKKEKSKMKMKNVDKSKEEDKNSLKKRLSFKRKDPEVKKRTESGNCFFFFIFFIYESKLLWIHDFFSQLIQEPLRDVKVSEEDHFFLSFPKVEP